MRILIASALILASFPGTVAAQERFTAPFGGRGGQQFIARCPAGAELTGIFAITGAYVNSIAPMCDGRQGPGFGGEGADRRKVECPKGSVVSSVYMISLRSDNHLLKKVTIDCVSRATRAPTARVDLDTPGRYTRPFTVFNPASGYPTTTQTCGQQRILGLQGRAGASIDALGLICG
jgi:hypothetical protein